MSPSAPNSQTPPGNPGRPTEAELLELIEGGLSPAREREVRAAAATDSELAGHLLRMMQHRSMLRQIDQSMEARAPSDLAEQAVSRARSEHMESMNHSSSHAGTGRIVGRHGSRKALAVAATIALCTIGGWVWFMVSRVGPGGAAITLTPYSTPRIDIDRSKEKDAVAFEPSLPGPEEDAYGNEYERVIADSRTITESMQPNFVGPPVLAAEVQVRSTVASDGTIPAGRGNAESMLDEWVANLGGLHQGEVMSNDRAAELLGAGKLRIVLNAGMSDAVKRRVVSAATGNGGGPLSQVDAGVFAADAGAERARPGLPAPQPVRASPDADKTIVLVVPKGRDRAELAASLGALLERVAKASGGEARFDEAVPNEDPLAGLETSDLLWWTKPSDQWDRGSVLRVPVIFAGAAAAR
ncbi:MAG: hypothetical protein ACKVZJ_03135 [Phycisphaerales bacterium]